MDDRAASDVRELRDAAVRLRELVGWFRETPVSEFVPLAAAGLLESIAEQIARDGDVHDSIRQRALETARHLPPATDPRYRRGQASAPADGETGND